MSEKTTEAALAKLANISLPMAEASRTVTCAAVWKWGVDRLASVRFAMVVIAITVLACTIGTLLPQGNEAMRYVQQHPEAAQRMKVLGALGLTQVYSSWWFVAVLGLLAATVSACSTRRFASARRTAGFARRRAIGSMLTHLSVLLILAGGVVRGLWGQKGFLQLREGESANQFKVGEKMAALPFTVCLEDFAIETYAGGNLEAAPPQASTSKDSLVIEWPARQLSATLPVKLGHEHSLHLPGAADAEMRVKVLQYVADFVIDNQTQEVRSRSDTANNPAILVAVKRGQDENRRWLFAKYPAFSKHAGGAPEAAPDELKMVYRTEAAATVPAIDGPIKSFKSTVKVLEGDAAVQAPVIEVNRPFRYKGYTLYQTGYNPKDLTWTSFQVVRDPGVPLVYAGFGVMIAGLSLVFYLNPWMETRRNRS